MLIIQDNIGYVFLICKYKILIIQNLKNSSFVKKTRRGHNTVKLNKNNKNEKLPRTRHV